MAAIYKRPASRYWLAVGRDATGKPFCRSTKIEHSPRQRPGESPGEHRRRAVENERTAWEVADNMEQALRGNRTESQLRKLVKDVSETVNRRAVDFPTAGKWLETWLERQRAAVTKSTLARYENVINRFVESLNAAGRGDVQLADIRPDDVENYKAGRLASGIKPQTVRCDLKILNTPFGVAMKQGVVLSNPVAAVTIPKDSNETRRPFTESEIDALAEAAAPEWRTAILLSAFGGLRLGDCVSLTWANIDTVEKTITFRPAKTARSKRDLTIPLHPRIEGHLLSLPTPDAPDAPLCPRLSKVKPGGRSGLSLQFAGLIKKAGIENETVKGSGEGRAFNVRSFHSLRHSFVTRLEAAGVPPDLRMKLSGHTDTKSHNVYSKTGLETLRAAVLKI